MQKIRAVSSLNRNRTARSVLLRMTADADRAQRLKDIKDSRPDLRWRHVAEAVGVTDRSVAEWAKTGALSYENAGKLARFLDVDLDWLWRGPGEAPDLMGILSPNDPAVRLAKIEQKLDDLVAAVAALELVVAGQPTRKPKPRTVSGARASARSA